MTTERKTESGSSPPRPSAAGTTGGVAQPSFTLRVTSRKQPASGTKETGEARAEQAPQPDAIAFVMADGPGSPPRPVRHGFLEHVFFDGELELRLWWEAEGPLHKGAIEL